MGVSHSSPPNLQLSAIHSLAFILNSHNMGADGGSIPDRRDLVKTKGKTQITDKALLRELYFFCALSKASRPCPFSSG